MGVLRLLKTENVLHGEPFHHFPQIGPARGVTVHPFDVRLAQSEGKRQSSLVARVQATRASQPACARQEATRGRTESGVRGARDSLQSGKFGRVSMPPKSSKRRRGEGQGIESYFESQARPTRSSEDADDGASRPRNPYGRPPGSGNPYSRPPGSGNKSPTPPGHGRGGENVVGHGGNKEVIVHVTHRVSILMKRSLTAPTFST